MTGCRNVSLTSARSASPAKDQLSQARTPTVQPLPCQTTTPVGPVAHFPAPSSSSVAVGSRKMGPAPKVKSLNVRFGEKQSPCVVSRRPDCEAEPGKRPFWLNITGRIVREITYQSSLSVNGTTGWMFTNHCEPSLSVPTSPL